MLANTGFSQLERRNVKNQFFKKDVKASVHISEFSDSQCIIHLNVIHFMVVSILIGIMILHPL